jgi:nucleoside-diphosphate-sugar epimerase
MHRTYPSPENQALDASIDAADARGMAHQDKVAVVVGAQGVIGRTLVDHLAGLDDWQVVGLSRRPGTATDRVRHVRVDLLDPADCRDELGGLREVTHVFYAAYQDRPTWAELVGPNLAMLANVVEVLDDSAPGLQHVSLMQGYKVYGAHLGPFRTPARESDPGHMPPEFNVAQQDHLERLAADRPWGWSAIRPSVVCGVALDNPMNLVNAIAVYASISKELGLPLRFPGAPGAYGPLLEMTDAGLLARATVWAATDPRCTDQAFNIANGDLFRWDDMWPRIADWFGLDVAPPLPMSLTGVMADKEPVWDRMAERHGLRATYAEVSSWAFADGVFGWDYDFFADGSKARRFGFHEYVETAEMFPRLFGELRARRVIP